jgi:uncharacterized repeat protein (TIGR03847 family)
MPRQLFEFDPPERFVVGAVGEPGQRTFYLQAVGAGRVTTVALEKQQVAVLADRVDALLDEVLRRGSTEAVVPAVAPRELEDNAPLDAPVLEEFRVGTMALAWDSRTERVLIEAQEATEDEDESELIDADDEDGPSLLRVHLSGGMARAFVKRAQAVVAAGRPPCPFCGQPLDPQGHICARANGYRR